MLGLSEADKCWLELKIKQQKEEVKQQKAKERLARQMALEAHKQELLQQKRLAEQEKLDRELRCGAHVRHAI